MEEKLPLLLRDVLKVYLIGWVLIPLGLLFPLFLCIPEIQQALGYQLEFNGFGNPKAGEWFFVGSILWIIIGVWKLMDWDDNGGLPRG